MATLEEMDERNKAVAAYDAKLAERMKPEEWPQIESSLNRAIARVADSDFELLEDGRNERAVAHRLAVYLEDEFQGWHVDCEFNRQGEMDAAKSERDRKQVSSAPPLLEESYEDTDMSRVEPDIIVHRRRKKLNLLVIEVKPSDSAGIERDKVKLRKYLSEPHLKYAFAALVVYRIGSNSGFEPVKRIEQESDSD